MKCDFAKMAEIPLNVVIIGGSLTALFHGIVFRRLGHRVQILERNPQSMQASQGAGIAAMEHVLEFLDKHDQTGVSYSVASRGVQFLDRSDKVKSTWNISIKMTTWKILYCLMRANFDGFVSEICPNPAKIDKEQESVSYVHGKEVKDVEYKDGLVTVKYRDIGTDLYSTVDAGLVLACDGASSAIRQKLQPNLQQKYVGYVAWRGTSPETEISEETKAVFACKTSFFTQKHGYIVLYTIPGEDGNTSEGHRQLNWIWYQVCPEDSQEYVDVMTDIDGHRHHTTLPPGKIDPRNWKKQKALALRTLPKPFAEMVQKTRKPFISAINDRELAQPSFFDGKLLFVGDSLATFRPHVASSTNQGALNALLPERLMKGEIDAARWEAQARAFAEFTTVRSQLWGAYYISGVLTLTFVMTFARYWKTFIAQAIWNRLYR
ncbi:Monooxygenase FAD-binding protein [Rutstroemia sp. NJR-2017a BVV2]|nr:Monooxygenase FAD-binding protein [Rutstroemia sp. NJR-2017a BVV2]